MNIKKVLLSYLTQAEIIHRKGKPIYYNTMRRLGALDRLKILKYLADASSQYHLANHILKYEDDLRAVLPHHNNKGHQATLKNLETLFNNAQLIAPETKSNSPLPFGR